MSVSGSDVKSTASNPIGYLHFTFYGGFTMKIFLMGYRSVDFEDKQQPGRRVQGFSLYLGQEANGVTGVIPVSDGGKRFINADRCSKIGLTENWLKDRIGDFINVDIDFDGKVVLISDLDDDKSEAV